jgi:hypothetical protein
VPEPIKSTVGDGRRALAGLAGVDPASIRHYVIAADTDEGVILEFCCDDRMTAAALFAEAARLVMTVRGEALHPDGPVPGMPGDSR